MIVKNEEKNIEKALSWGKQIMWEQVVVDTGSTDRTVELAEKLGANVFRFPWIDDFSAAKNYAIEQAKGEWIAFLDADEYMDAESAIKIKEVIQRLSGDSFDGISTGCQQLDEDGNIFSSGTQIRFFRNLPDIRYRRRVHEQLESVSGRELRIGSVEGELSIFHTGYQKKAMEEKGGRNRRLILEELKENPEDYEMLGYMGDECFEDNETEEAEQWYRRCVRYMPAKLRIYDQRSAVTFTRLIYLLMRKGKEFWGEAEQVYRQAVISLPEEADFDYMMGRLLAGQGQTARAAAYLERSVEKLNTYGRYNKAFYLGANLPETYELLVKCFYEAGEPEKCMEYGTVYLKYDRYGMGVLSRLLLTLFPEGKRAGEAEYQQVLQFFGKLYDFGNLKDRLFLIKTAERSGCQGFGDYALGRLFSDEERKSLRLEAGKGDGN